MDAPLDIKDLAPKAPGYILAPTAFLLDGHADDFTDWDEASGTPEEDHWADDSRYWLLGFRALPESKDRKSVILDSEICIDILGGHRCVPLSMHWGKDLRPASARAAGSILHAWGWRYPDSYKNPYDLYHHWILASPFQLAWSSLPPFNSNDHCCDWTAFEKWADRRGLEHTFLTSEQIGRGKVVVPVASTWREGFVRNRELAQAISRLHRSPQKCNERFLYDLVNLALHENPSILPHLDKAKFDAYGEALTKQDRADEKHLIEESVRFDSFLDGKRYRALKQDAEATKEIGASNKMLVIMGRIYRGVSEAPVVAKRLPDKAAYITDYLKKHYDGKSAFKDLRKAAKSYWYLVKTFLEVAEIKNGVPEWLAGYADDFGTKWYGQELKLVGQSKSAIRIFDPAAVSNIKKQSSGSIPHLRFYAFLEGLNVALATSDLLHAKTSEEKWKKVIALTGSLGSLSSALIDLQKAMNMNVLGKLATRRVTTKVLSGLGSAADLTLGIWAISDDLKTHDEEEIKFHAAQAFGGLLGVVGYIMMATGVGAPAGALLVFLGSGFGMGGSLAASIFKTTELEQWVKFCRWGILAGKEGFGEAPTSWADGVPRELYLQTAKQIRTLSTLLVGLRADARMLSLAGQCDAEIDVHVALCAEEGSIDLEVLIEGATVRKMSLWKHGKDRDADGMLRERFPLNGGTNVTIRVRVKPFPEVPYQVPSDKAMETTVVLAASPLRPRSEIT
jgi:hypothetical protein